jgi:hypothetical protein
LLARKDQLQLIANIIYNIKEDVMLNQLTDYELVGLRGGYNLSDGHAYHDINENFPDFPLKLLDIWKDSESTRVNLVS